MSDTKPNLNPIQKQLKTCSDGFDRYHHMITPKAEYSGFGWFLVTFGITAKPKKIKYYCRKCNEIFDESTETEDIEKNT
ncbi:hypothetical protein QEJ31_08205 [Pigmentibacter sp. JX0631]|uniref:hypothetical protein n=1 Tax=Pigmentibacter sp. JX0631 TaxID=2976982 RepID=UPI00246833FB|nr:hypothetical protein [Pigmentibacter sp. JX0631]WGL58521.1 hypothetical protein QEJ31_08205 [Pigmentibacter sp. JX0631]